MQPTFPINYRKFYKESPGALFECEFNDAWSIIKCSDSFFSQLGFDKSSYTSQFGNSFLVLMPPKTKERFLVNFQNYIEDHKSNPRREPLFTKVFLRRHDRLFQPVQLLVRLIDDGHLHLSCTYMPCFDEQEPLSLNEDDHSDRVQEKLKQKVGTNDDYARSFKGKTILLAEDHPLNIRMISTILHRYGINVEVANNGLRVTEMFESADEGHFFAVLMDIIMPLVNGDAAAEQIRSIETERGSEKSVPIFAMYSNTDADYKDGWYPGCFSGSLSKPVTLSRLMDILGSC